MKFVRRINTLKAKYKLTTYSEFLWRMINILRHLLIPFNFFLHFVKTISFCGNISILKIVRRFKLHIQRNVFQRGTSLRSKQMLSSHFIILNVINSKFSVVPVLWSPHFTNRTRSCSKRNPNQGILPSHPEWAQESLPFWFHSPPFNKVISPSLVLLLFNTR